MLNILRKIKSKLINSREITSSINQSSDFVPKNKEVKNYFNNGAPPLDQNTELIYDQFYSDEEALDNYYEEQRLSFYKKVYNKISSSLVLSDKKILDVGCGNGHLLNEIQTFEKNTHLSGCDFSQQGINYSKKIFPSINFFRHDVYNPIEDQFDIIICTEVLEHLEYPELAIENMLNSLNEGGILVLTVPDGRKDTIEEHINFWSNESWRCFIKRESKKLKFKTSTIENNHNYAEIYK